MWVWSSMWAWPHAWHLWQGQQGFAVVVVVTSSMEQGLRHGAWPRCCGHGLRDVAVASVVGRDLWSQAWPRKLTICRTSEETICMQHMAVASAHTMVETTLRAHTLKRRSWEQRGEVSVWPSGQQSPPRSEKRRGTQGSCCRQTGP